MHHGEDVRAVYNGLALAEVIEEKMIEAMEQALRFLEENPCDILYRISIFHYLLAYIHPFYDGNGRLGRFIYS